MNKLSMWECSVESGYTGYVLLLCPYDDCDSAPTNVFGYSLTEIHAAAREHFAEVHNGQV